MSQHNQSNEERKQWISMRSIILTALIFVVLISVLTGISSGSTPGDGYNISQNNQTALDNSTNSSQVCIVYFYSAGCPYCENISDYLDNVEKKQSVSTERYRLGLNPEAYQSYAKEYNISGKYLGTTPVIFLGEHYTVGEVAIQVEVESALDSGENISCPNLEKSYSPGGKPTSLDTVATISALAIGDAINPCALAVLLILLTTILSRYPDNRRKLLAGGLAFAFAVMGTYLIMGLILIAGIKALAQVSGLDIAFLRPLFGGAAIFLGILNLGDWVFDNGLKIVPEVPESWRPSMQRYLTGPLWEKSSIITGAGLAGVGVSLFLLPCTSGPYFVAGGILANRPWIFSGPLLVLYNFIFILPMIAITFVVFKGLTTVEDVSSWRETNIHRLHAVTGITLIILGALLVIGIV